MNPELKELLQLAAKAAGYEVKETGGSGMWLINPRHQWWAPNYDREQAFRLAHDAGLVVNFGTCRVLCWVDGSGVGAFDWTKDNPESMCMAIVRAAAEKGRAM